MGSRHNVILDRFFTALISGDRETARCIVDEALGAEAPAQRIISHLFWPTLQHIQTLRREDQLTALAHNYATRLLRMLIEQMQLRLEPAQPNGTTTLVVCGDEQSEELAAQMTCDLLEAAGYTVYFAGGGIANDEVVEQLGELKCDKLVIFGAVAATVPATRLLIDRLHEIGPCPDLQIAVGGGVFNRAQGLAEEIGADLWAADPAELVEVIQNNPGQRMSADQRTVGRRRRPSGSSSAKRQAA